jgi:hypothetical protein
MPLTSLQRKLLRIIAHNRTPQSYVAGGSVMNADDIRYSADIDLFSDRIEALTAAIRSDTKALRAAGIAIKWQAQSDAFHRAVVSDGADSTRLDWAVDSDFRFYPAQKDDRFGYALHPIDLATNKLLAAEGRNEVRDAIDLMTVDAKIMPLGATAWAAAAKSPGLTPDGIIEGLRARARSTDAHIAQERLTKRLGAAELNSWLRSSCDAARVWLGTVPQGYEFGLFIDANGQPRQPDFAAPDSTTWRIHEGHRGGAWPSSSEISVEMIQHATKRRSEGKPSSPMARSTPRP